MIFDKINSAKIHLKAKTNIIETIAQSKLLNNEVVINVIIILITKEIELIINISFSFLNVFKYVLINKAIFPSYTHIGKRSAIYFKLSKY